MGGRELITLQLGNFANYVGAHFWNLQDELLGYADDPQWRDYTACINTDMLYMTGEDRQGHTTYQPRALMVDLCGALGGARISGDPGGPAPASVPPLLSTWGGGMEVHRSQPLARSAFVQQLEEQARLMSASAGELSEAEAEAQQAALEAAARLLMGSPGVPGSGVHYWTDYLKALVHPRSLYCLPGLWHGVNEFSGYGEGYAACGAGSEVREELGERLRFLAEACDSLQGFQVLVDDTAGGFGGLAAALLEEVHEEYGAGRPVALFAVKPHRPDLPSAAVNQRARCDINSALTLSALSEVVALYTPLTVPPASFGRACSTPGLTHLSYSASEPYHAAAILAATLDTALLPVRVTENVGTPCGEALGGVNLHSLATMLTSRQQGRPLTALSLGMPAPHLPSDVHQLAAHRDRRLQHPHSRQVGSEQADAGASQGQGEALADGGSLPSCLEMHDLTQIACLTPGITDYASSCLAECITVRGPRDAWGPAPTSRALGSLDALLLSGPRRRCVQHRVVCPVPLPVPLPFPHIFHSAVSKHGDMSEQPSDDTRGQGRRSSSEGGGGGGHVHTVPLVAKLLATAEYEQVVRQVGQRFRSAAGTSGGKALLDAWGYQAGDVESLIEGLQEQQAVYAGEYGSDVEL